MSIWNEKPYMQKRFIKNPTDSQLMLMENL